MFHPKKLMAGAEQWICKWSWSNLGLPWWLSSKRLHLRCRRHRRCWFHPWIGKIPWRRKWQPTPVFLLGISHGQRSLEDCRSYSPQGHKEWHDWAQRGTQHWAKLMWFWKQQDSSYLENTQTNPFMVPFSWWSAWLFFSDFLLWFAMGHQ